MFEAHPDVDEIIVMMATGHLDDVRAIMRAGNYRKVVCILEGGETRNATLRTLEFLGDRERKLLLHDAVRLLVSARVTRGCYSALDDYDAVDVAIPSADTIIEVPSDNTIRSIPPRAHLRRGQTRRPSRHRFSGPPTRGPRTTRASSRPTTAAWCSTTPPTSPFG